MKGVGLDRVGFGPVTTKGCFAFIVIPNKRP